jgi:phosphoribosylanthranilate isomerase
MLKPKIYVSEVTNLTDARYFAAMGVDYLGFCCNEDHPSYIRPERIREIMDWVEGPQAVLEFLLPASISEIQGKLDKIPCNAVHLGLESGLKRMHDSMIFQDIILGADTDVEWSKDVFYVLKAENAYSDFTDMETSHFSMFTENYQCFIDFSYLREDLLNIIHEYKVYGIVLKGGPEDITGVKSFDFYEPVFELINTFN